MPAKWQLWMPFQIDRFKGSPSVQAMHPAARAGYLYLLSCQWQSEDCTVSSDPLDLAEMSGLGDELWQLHGARILRKFDEIAPGKIRNQTCFEEWVEAKGIYEKRRASADRTNKGRSPSLFDSVTERGPSRLADTRTTVVPVPVSVSVPVGKERPPDFSLDHEAEIPEGLAIVQYAGFVCEQAHIPASYALKVKVGDAIRMLAAEECCTDAKATALMLPRLIQAQLEGEKINFWLEDGRWKTGAPPRNGNGHQTPPNPGAQKSAPIAEDEARLMWESMSEAYRKANPWQA